jgi:hypothetical protein
MKIRWRIYYGDGTVIYDTCPIEETPTSNVQVILWKCPVNNWLVITSYDYYVWKDVRWFGMDIFGLWDYLTQPGWKRVLFGRAIDNKKYDDTLKQALADRKQLLTIG